VLAGRIAEKIAEIKGVDEAYVKIVSQIGRAIDDPHMANVQLVMERGSQVTSNIQSEIRGIVENSLDSIGEITEAILEKRVILF
ncbi:MAG: methionine adenosyltransferase, partial [Candidatus Methanosuratincola petrocarbonis]